MPLRLGNWVQQAVHLLQQAVHLLQQPESRDLQTKIKNTYLKVNSFQIFIQILIMNLEFRKSGSEERKQKTI